MKNIILILLLSISLQSHAQEHSYIWGMHFPALVEPAEVCCFDFDNDNTLDDGLGEILVTLEGQLSVDFQASIDTGLLDNSLVRAFNWQNLDLSLTNQNFTFEYLDAQTVTPNLTLLERQSGLSQIYLTNELSGNVFDAVLDTGIITATANQISGLLNLQLDADQGLVPLTINTVKVEMQLTDSPLGLETGIYSDDIAATTPDIVGGIKIGGILPGEEFLGALDSQYRTCSCAGVDPNQQLITSQVTFLGVLVSCTQTNFTEENCDANSFCSSVQSFCDQAVGIGTTYDIDENGDNKNDAYSVALRYGAAATTIIDIIYRHGFEN